MCWGLFRYFSAHAVNQAASDSPFADTRQLPLGPQLQVNPREDWLKFREEQEQSLETYAWENRAAGTVRVPIERAMELLVKKGLPVQGASAGATPLRCKESRRRKGAKSHELQASIAAMLLALTAIAALSARAQQVTTPAILSKVGIAQNLNPQIPPDLVFRDETGKSVRLGDYFGKKADRAFAGLFRLPRAVHGSSQRRIAHHESDLARSRKGFRSGDGQLRAEGYPRAGQGKA